MRRRGFAVHGLAAMVWLAAPHTIASASAVNHPKYTPSPRHGSLQLSTSLDEPIARANVEGARDDTAQAQTDAMQGSVGRSIRRYLERPIAPSARFADHGVLRVASALGSPHRYRLETSIGLFDHLELGITAHWLPGEARPAWAPMASLAFFRYRNIEVGLRYLQLLADERFEDPTTPVPPRSHYLLGSAAFSQWWYSVGFDLGVARFGEDDRFDEVDGEAYVERTRIAAGIFARFGNRRWGIVVQGLMPSYAVECMFEVRFEAFGRRRMDRWGTPTGV